jgi:hypothetical protein
MECRADTMADHEDPEFVMSQVKLAAAYKAAGDVRQAISLLEQTLVGSQRALGTDHLVTAAVRNNLAAAYRAAGEVELEPEVSEWLEGSG